MRRHSLTALQAVLYCAPVVLALGVTSCTTSGPVACAGQCAPPYELLIQFRAGTPGATAQKILRSCAGRDPVVIRIGALQEDQSQAFIYTRVFATAETARLTECLRSSFGVIAVGWPD
jgi:hypothetical protein